MGSRPALAATHREKEGISPMASEADANAYVLGYSSEEQRRLDQQGAMLRPFTARLLQAAGIGPGMRVLDVGCGTGDVALLAAALVGPAGHVVGVDRSPAVLATAASRVAARGWQHVTFVEDDIASMTVAQPVDAVVGRLVLMYQPDPAATLRHLATLAAPGGALAFLEMVMSPGLRIPERPLFTRVHHLVRDTFTKSGADIEMGLRLEDAFRDAGLTDPTVQVDAVTVVGPDRAWLSVLAGVTRSLLPASERFGLATAQEIEIDTLLDRLLAEAAENSAVPGPTYVGAWQRTPDLR
jgi:SAM-dependent methyltransferase